MSDVLKSERRGPQKAGSVVIFLHGYGADGADLLGLATPLAQILPDTAFYAPDAPDPCGMNPMGRQWFPIPWIDGSSEAEAGAGMAASAEKLDAFMDHVLETEGVDPKRLILVGFSQGTMMSLHVAPRRDMAIGGIAGFSGRLMMPGALSDDARSRPPVLLLHGDADEVVSFDSMAAAEDALRAADFEVETFVMSGVGHGISPEGLQRAVEFILPKLS